MSRTLGLLALAAVVLLSCSREGLIRQMQLKTGGMTISLGVSPVKGEPAKIVGRLKIVNDTTSLVKYGNLLLFLSANGDEAVTRLDTRNKSPWVDSALVDLSPGDTLEFFTSWVFPKAVEFRTAAFSLKYRGPVPQEPAAPPADSAKAP